jgi:hypothetical protein
VSSATFPQFHKEKIAATGPEQARASRLGGVPERGAQHKKFLTRSVWLNNNKLRNIRNVDAFVDSILEFPEKLGWLDCSFNQITEIHEVRGRQSSQPVNSSFSSRS